MSPPTFVNPAVLAVLRSPLRRVVNGAVCEIDYRGRQSGRTVRFPAMYRQWGDGIVVAVADHEAKQWWRNFRSPHHATIRLPGGVTTMKGEVLQGSSRSEAQARYLDRFPKADEAIDDSSPIIGFTPAGPAPTT